MGELYKTQHTIDEMLDRMGVKIVLDSEHLSEEDKAAGKPAAFLCFLSGGLPLCVW